MEINGRKIGAGEPAYIIAEIGVNHGGDMELAEKMVLAAKKSGADAVKFQTFVTEDLVTPQTPKVAYQKRTTVGDDRQAEMLRKLEFRREDHPRIQRYCEQIGIDFLSTPYDVESAKFLDSIAVPAFKTASADVVDLLLHRCIAATQRPVIIATGMSTMEEIGECLREYGDQYADRVVLLHCVSNYPCEDASIHLRGLDLLRDHFGANIGYSDHGVGSLAASLSIALGGSMIEKHFTLDKGLPGPDHQASSTPEEFRKLVDTVRRAELILGRPEKACRPEEEEMRRASRKSLTLASPVESGDLLRADHFVMKRPGTGLPARALPQLVGRRAQRSMPVDCQPGWDDVK